MTLAPSPPTQFRLISWNVAGKRWCLDHQVAALGERTPDIVALQEVRPSTAGLFAAGLAHHGLKAVLESATQAGDAGRRYGLLIASRWPLTLLSAMDIPYPERVLSALAHTPWGDIEIHTTHIPPGEGNGWIKIETFEGIYKRLACEAIRPRLLCGDFNSPQHETVDGELITFGQMLRANGTTTLDPEDVRWDAGERGVLEGLRAFDLHDTYRALNGYGVSDWSWRHLATNTGSGRRFDHIFAARALHPTACAYDHAPRRSGLSDHALIKADFAPVFANASTTPTGQLPATSVAGCPVPPPRPRLPHHARGALSRSGNGHTHLRAVDDIRDTDPNRDGRRQAQFRTGWQKAVSGVSFQEESLSRLTWHNLGYRLGLTFGATSPVLIDQLYAWCVEQQREGRSIDTLAVTPAAASIL